MARRNISVLVLAFVFIGAYCENATEAPKADDTTWKETGICRKCICKDDKVNCFDQGIVDFFKKEEWANLKPMKPATIDLSENMFRNITAMAELPVKVLNLSRCSVETIEKASFKDLQQMQVLDLSHNKLTTENLSPHAFEGRYQPEQYEPLASMRTLNLAYNDLHSLNQDLFEHLPELSELDLSGNPLTTIDHVTVIAISSLPMLKDLFGHMLELSELDLSDKLVIPQTTIDHVTVIAISSLPMLKVLRLRSCGLSDIPDKFLHTPRFLERLDISDNQLTSVPQELKETKNLVYLNLNQNPIKEMDENSDDYPGFPRLRKLQELHMCNMKQLTRVGPGALAGLENLQRLHISYNSKLHTLDPRALARPDGIGETFDWPLVKELYIQSNNLSEIDSRFLSRWDLLEALDVSNNPYLCDCSTQWMVSTLVGYVEHKVVNASEKMVCAEPIEMKGYTMKHLHDIHRTMRCVDKYGNRPEKDGAILLGTLIGVLLAVPIMFSLMLLWRHGYLRWMGLRGPVDVSRAFYKRAPSDENYI